MSAKDAFFRMVAGEVLDAAAAEALFSVIFAGQLSHDEIAALLAIMHRRGESVDEIIGAVRAARAAQVGGGGAWAANAIDTCGTGGDGLGTFNVSTAVALAAAAAGVPVIKHGNRAQTSRCGSADVLEALGVKVDLDEAAARRHLAAHGFVFLFAPLFHPGFKHVAPVRKSLSHRTIFNVLGPLVNPAGVQRQVIGVFAREWVMPLAKVLAGLGHARAIVAYGETDELSTWATNHLAIVEDGQVREAGFSAGELGVAPPDMAALRGEDAAKNAALIRDVLAGRAAPAAIDLVALNLAAALWVAGRGAEWRENFAVARDHLQSGEAAAWLARVTG